MTITQTQKGPPHKRSLAREFCLKFLYGHFGPLTQENLNEEVLSFIPSYIEEDKEHPNNLYDEKVKENTFLILKLIIKNLTSLEEILEKHCTKRKFSKTDKMIKWILLLGASELLYTDTPLKVILNEYINLSKAYADQDSYSFVNAVLDAVATERKT